MTMTSALLNALMNEGCPVENSLTETFMGNEKLYERLLKKLGQTEDIEKMEQACAAGDAKACFEAGHDLKGMYATLGLEPLHTRCAAIVDVVRNGSLEGVDAALPELKSLHAHFLEIIASY